MSRIIAIDGPSGAGKSTISRRVGKILGFLHVDSGALYRIVTWQCLEHGIDTADPTAVAAFVKNITIECQPIDGSLSYFINGQTPGDAIRTPKVNRHASPVATVKAVRDYVTDFLRALTRFGDLIVEGRDITTAVFPDAQARFYLVASADARAARRQQEEIEKGIAHQSTEEVKQSLLSRDQIDSTRQYAPLRKADGAIEIDSTNFEIPQTVQVVLNHLPTAWLPN